MDTDTTIPSAFGPYETMDRLEAAVHARGMTVFGRIDHAEGATRAGLTLRPTVLLIFGNPQTGSILMQANQSIGLDLPLRALVWQDEHGRTWISSMNPCGLPERYGVVGSSIDHTVQAMTTSLKAIMHAASSGA